MTANSPFNRCLSASSPDRAATISPTSSRMLWTASRLRSSSSTRRTRGRSTSTGSASSDSRNACTGIPPTGPVIFLLRCLQRNDFRRFLSRLLPGPCAPDAQQREQKLDVDRLRDVIGSPGIEALLPVAFHRLCSNGDQRKIGKRRTLPDLLHRFIAVHVGHHDVDEADIDARRLLKDQYPVLST